MVEFCNMTQEHHLVANWNNLSWKCYLVVEILGLGAPLVANLGKLA